MTDMIQVPELAQRPTDAHKGTFGTVLVIGGCARSSDRLMVGGPAFTAIASLRSGAGLSVLAVPEPLATAALEIAPEATVIPLPVLADHSLDPSATAAVLDAQMDHSMRVLAIGPGMGTSIQAGQVVMRLISRPDRMLVLDADALNVMSRARSFDMELKAPCILTPHPGEFARLAHALDLDIDGTDPDRRLDAAVAMAMRLGCIVVLKGSHTIVTDGQRAHVNTTGGPVLATAGSGDCLAGIIAGLLAQYADVNTPCPGDRGLSMLQCAVLGVHLHGLAGDRIADRRGDAGMLARELLQEIPAAMDQLRKG